jgi:peptidoglycan hydrolase CwlO-like protein
MAKRLIFFFLMALFVFTTSFTYAEEDQNQQKNELEKKITEYQRKLDELRQQKNTLFSQIQYMDTQIYLTSLRIQETEDKITSTQKEIEALASRIEGLDSSLDYLSKLLLNKITEGYKQRSVSVFSLLLDSGNANDFLNRIKYLKIAQNNNQKLLIQVQQTKLNFEEQRTLREEKKMELDNLIDTLGEQKSNLDNQKAAKQKLLTDTQNDENTYQKLLSEAQKQLSAFKSFVQSSGANSTISANAFGTGSDGAYYSQRDERWAYKSIGYSSENVLNVGCLLTSIAMFAKKNGDNLTPLDLASDVNRFWGNTAWMQLPWPSVAGKRYSSLSISEIDQELANGNYVIVGVMINNCYAGGNHYVVLTKKDGSDYIMHDPIYGPDIKLSSHYSTICSAATFK